MVAGQKRYADTASDRREISLDENFGAERASALFEFGEQFIAVVSAIDIEQFEIPLATRNYIKLGMSLGEPVGNLFGEPGAQRTRSVVGKREVEKEGTLFAGGEKLKSEALGERGDLRVRLRSRGGKKLLSIAPNAKRRGHPDEEEKTPTDSTRT